MNRDFKMKYLLIIPLVIMSLVSFPSWGNEITGKYICEQEFEDGSTNQFLIDVSDSSLSKQYLKHDIKRDYKRIFKSPHFGTSVFTSDPSLIILSRIDKNNVIEINQYQFIDGSDDEFIRGHCERSYIN